MCGIYGFVSHNKDLLNSIDHKQATNLLSHRGPDDTGFLKLDNIFLGHTRLSILDVENAAQPMWSGNKNSGIIYNGEIYNMPELRGFLKNRSVDLKTNSDTEVIIELYELLGIKKTLELIEGMFAFGIWDTASSTLYIARDRIGEKFLYFSQSGSSFAFASEIKAILSTKLFDDSIYAEGLYEYLCRAKVSGEKTFYQNILELPPGSYIEINEFSKAPKILQYWSILDVYDNEKSNKFSNPSLACKIIGENLNSSIQERMLSDVPVGLLVSGGLDSSFIVGSLARLGFKGLTGYCAGNFQKEIDESPFAEEMISYVNRKYNADYQLKTIKKHEKDLLENLPYLSFIHDEPIIFLNSLQLFEVCKQANEDGKKVLISGEGSDEIFCGYNRHNEFINEIRSNKLHRNRIIEKLYYGGGLHSLDIIEELCTPIKIVKGDTWDWLEANVDIAGEELILYFDQYHRLQTLLQRQDRIGMAAHIELRQPYLKYQLFNAANQLDINLKYEQTKSIPKWVLKQISKTIVPDSIINRVKTGFPTDLQKWFDSDEGICKIEKMVFNKDSISSNYLDNKALEKLFIIHKENRNKNYLMQRLYFLEVWNLNRLL
jgi:asparagine synthase (glutamine-hydrolysing)